MQFDRMHSDSNRRQLDLMLSTTRIVSRCQYPSDKIMNIGILAHSMPRRLARVSHREIAHAAKEAIQAEVVIGNEEQIRIVLSPDASAVSQRTTAVTSGQCPFPEEEAVVVSRFHFLAGYSETPAQTVIRMKVHR
jgi:hypothetical protein